MIQIFDSGSSNYLETINVRHAAAKNYFFPVLKELSKTILIHIELLKDEKQTKAYLEELLELEGLLFKQIQLLDKTSTVIENVLNNVEFNKQQIRKNTDQNERLELVRNSIAIADKAKFEERKLKVSKKATSKTKVEKAKVAIEKDNVKINTKEITFNLYKEGKSIMDISKDRTLAVTTIETHLAHYVSLGMIPVTQFVSAEKVIKITDFLKNHEGHSSTTIKLELGNDYSYSEIKFVLSTQKYIDKE